MEYSDYVKGATYARDCILALITLLKDSASDKFAPWAVGFARESLQDMYNELQDCFGEVGSDFKDEYLHYMSARVEPSFEAGFDFGVKRLSGFLHIAQAGIGHACKHSISYKSLQWLSDSIEERYGNEKTPSLQDKLADATERSAEAEHSEATKEDFVMG